MPLRDDLLNPIPGENPSGQNLKYAPVYDKIKEARREDDDAPQGEWQRDRKVADHAQVIKLIGDALATKSKDLQLAVWLTEAQLKTEGFAGLHSGLTLIRGLIENFWDTLYPELEDGDAELRAAPLDWLGGRLDAALRNAPLTRKRHSWFQYKESRAVGYETDATTDDKLEARTAAIAEGKLTAEEWDQGVAATPKSFCVDLEQELDQCLELLQSLDELCQEKFSDEPPSFGPMRSTLEEIRHTVHAIVQKKRESDPDEAPAAEQVEVEPETDAGSGSWDEPAAVAAPPKARRKAGPQSAEPVDKDDAFERVIAVAQYLRREDPYSPAPYLLLRGLRWGELRAAGSSTDANLLEPPPTEIRQSLKRLANEGEWQQVLELAEAATGMPCGRGWLDAQRYSARAAYELGYSQIVSAIQSEVNALVADYPDLAGSTLLDDTPAANTETQTWLQEIAPASAPAAQSEVYYSPPPEPVETESDSVLDANDLAMQAARDGRTGEAIEILTREASAESSGRGRFQRRLQLAQLCMSMNHERIAHPILEQLAAEIDARGLEGWESANMVAHPLALFYRCLVKLNVNPELKERVYDRICRLDPVQALSCSR